MRYVRVFAHAWRTYQCTNGGGVRRANEGEREGGNQEEGLGLEGAVKALETGKQKHVVEGLLVQLGAPVPRAGQAPCESAGHWGPDRQIPSMQLPPSSPSPLKANLKKSVRISRRKRSAPPCRAMHFAVFEAAARLSSRSNTCTGDEISERQRQGPTNWAKNPRNLRILRAGKRTTTKLRRYLVDEHERVGDIAVPQMNDAQTHLCVSGS